MDAEQLLATRFGELVELGLLKAFAASGAIGLLIGLERERHPASAAGLRTFALTALFGTASALLGELGGTAWPTAIGLLLVGAMAVAAQRRDADPAGDPGTTTTIAILLCFILGTMVWHGLATIAARAIDTDFIDAVEKAERERKEREALEWAAAEVVAGDDDMKGDD